MKGGEEGNLQAQIIERCFPPFACGYNTFVDASGTLSIDVVNAHEHYLKEGRQQSKHGSEKIASLDLS